MSSISATSPVQQRDIRSASKPFKRDKDHDEKWSMGSRPLHGVKVNFNTDAADDELANQKVRPMKACSGEHKSHANKTPKPTGHPSYDTGLASGRVVRKLDAIVDANDLTASLSNSLLELLPQYANNMDSSIQTIIREADSGILYSFDNKGKSPSEKGREVELGGLVEMAEKKWVAQQTEKIVKGEYEVLDAEGETTVLPSAKGKKRGSPKQHAVKNEAAVVKNMEVEEDDGFELV